MIPGRALYLPEWGITSVFDLVVVFALEAEGTSPASEPWGRFANYQARARGTSPQRVHLSRTHTRATTTSTKNHQDMLNTCYLHSMIAPYLSCPLQLRAYLMQGLRDTPLFNFVNS